MEIVYDKSIVREKIKEVRKEYTDVLEKIEELCRNSDNEFVIMAKISTDKEIKLATVISEIYKLAHSHAGHCGNSHEDWRLKKKEEYVGLGGLGNVSKNNRKLKK